MASTRFFASVTGVVVVAILALALFSMSGSPPLSTTSNTSSGSGAFSAAAENVTAVYTDTMVRAPTTSATSSTSTASSSGSASATTTSSSTSALGSGDGGSYTYTPSSVVQVLSVSAEVAANQAGGGTVVFVVQFKNIGTDSIYVAKGGGSGLAVNVTSGGTILNQVNSPRCLLATAMVPIAPGAASEAVSPGCWSGYYYELVGPGTVGTEMVLTWTGSSSQGGGEGSITIVAGFTLS